ncbi:MAG: DUF736 family protein [Pseudomonadota bacterium]
MSINGELTRTDDNAITGWIASLTFDVSITLTTNPHKEKDTHPDYEVTATTPNGRVIRIGSAWNATSQKGNEYLSLSLGLDPGGQQIRVNALTNGDAGVYRLVALTGR